MGMGFATVEEDDGVLVTWADVNGFTLRELRFPPDYVTDAFRRLVELRGRGFNWLAWRLAGELRASDAAAPLAAEGFALEILAATAREAAIDRRVGRAPRWLGAAEELLRARIDDPIGL